MVTHQPLAQQAGLWYNGANFCEEGELLNTWYVTDLDGTLLDAQGRVSPVTASLLRPLVDRGLQLTVATARTPATVVELVRPLGLRGPAVLMSGALLYDLGQKKVLSTRGFSPSSQTALAALLESTDQDALVYCADGDRLTVFHRPPRGDYARSFIAQRNTSPYKRFVPVEHYGRAMADSRCLLALFCLPGPAPELVRALEKLPEVHCVCYADEYGRGVTVEVCPAGCHKGAGVDQLRRITGADRIVAFGDNVNDLPLFTAADESWAVANAAPQVRRAATGTIGSNREDGVARWLAAREGGV